MPPKSLTELAQNPDLISGIYNYCDRWCERCPLTSRCLVYASENESSESNDIRNANFWRTLSASLSEARELIPGWAKQAGVDLNKSAEENKSRRQRRLVDNHPLAKAGKKYANAASEWFRELDQAIDITANLDRENPQPFENAREVIQWYQYQIAVKTMRALSSRNEDLEDTDAPKDSDGSAKVALTGIDRSIAAWRLMQLSLPDRSESIVSLILQLERLRNNLLESFPKAPHFIRPGFDELLSAAN